MDAYLISRLPPAAVDDFVSQVESLGSRFLGPQYLVNVRSIVRGGPIHTVITTARNKHSLLPELVLEDETRIGVFSGYLVDDATHPRGLRQWFAGKLDDDRPILRSPGGIYSYATVRRSDGQVCAGHSTPTLEPVYYSEMSEGLHVGNNPLLVHMAAREFGRPEIDESFYLAAVSGGVALDDTTPFVGCYRVPPRAIVISGATTFGTRIRPAPRPEHGRYKLSTYRQRRSALTEALLQAGSVLNSLPKGELRVSGGKDSRLVAAYLSYAGTPVTPVNQNLPGEVEGKIADRVANVLGSESCMRAPRVGPSDPDDIHRRTRRKIAYAGGLPAAASLQYPNLSEGSVPGIPLIMGHAHLQRGGLVNRIRSVHQAIDAATSRTVSPYLRQAYSERNDHIVRRFVNETLAGGAAPQSVSFHAYLQFSMNYQFQSLYAYVRNWNPLITPLLDERFALLCEDIANNNGTLRPGEFAGVTDLTNERIALGTTEALAPRLLEFPLANDRYRCDAPEWKNYELRDPALIQPDPLSTADLSKSFNTRRTRPDVREHMWEHIEGTVVATFAEVTCRPEIWGYLSQPNTPPPEGENLTLLNQFLWSIYGLSVILGSDWWQDLADT